MEKSVVVSQLRIVPRHPAAGAERCSKDATYCLDNSAIHERKCYKPVLIKKKICCCQNAGSANGHVRAVTRARRRGRRQLSARLRLRMRARRGPPASVRGLALEYNDRADRCAKFRKVRHEELTVGRGSRTLHARFCSRSVLRAHLKDLARCGLSDFERLYTPQWWRLPNRMVGHG